jgi:hypothetical protein
MIFGPDNNMYVTNFNTNEVFRHDGTTGDFIDAFVTSGSGGLNGAALLTFSPADTTQPFFALTDPVDGAPSVAHDSDIEVHVGDSGSGVDLGTVVLTVNGAVVFNGASPGAYPNTAVTGDPTDYRLIYNPPVDFNPETIVSVTLSASDQDGNSASAGFSFQTAAPSGNPWDPSGDEDGDGIINGEEDANGNGSVDPGETDPSRKTLFVRPHMVNAGLTAFVYWPGFLALFPSPRAGFAEVPALSQAGIEVVVIGDPRHPYAPWKNFDHNPAGDAQRPHADIMELIYYDARFDSCQEYSDCENNLGHIYFDPGTAATSSGIPQWLFDIMGYTPGSPVDLHGYTHRYRTPAVYQKVIDNYLNEGVYAQLAAAQNPQTLTCTGGACAQDGANDASPFNLSDGEPGPPYDGAPDASAEFNDIAFNSTGRVTHVGANDKKRYAQEAILRRVLVHEIGHGLNLADHCWNPYCIMYALVPSWELHGRDGQALYGFGSSGAGPGGAPTQCEHSPGNSNDIRRDYDPTAGRNTGVFNAVH